MTKRLSFLQELNALQNRDSVINSLCNTYTSITKIEVYNDFNFKEGKFIGFLKQVSRTFKKRTELAQALKVSERVFDLFLDAFGTPTYLDRYGNIVSSKAMDIPRVLEIIKYLEDLWQIPTASTLYVDFNKEHLDAVYERAEEYVKDQLLTVNATYEE